MNSGKGSAKTPDNHPALTKRTTPTHPVTEIPSSATKPATFPVRFAAPITQKIAKPKKVAIFLTQISNFPVQKIELPIQKVIAPLKKTTVRIGIPARPIGKMKL